MSELDSRLSRCLATIFPDLSEENINACDMSVVITADSLAAVTLLALLEEEFGVALDIEELLTLRTFAAIRDRLQAKPTSDTVSVESRVP